MKFYTPRQNGAEIVFVLLLFLTTGYTCQVLAGEDVNQSVRIIAEDEMPLILGLIASDIRQNYERIKTWSGEIDENITWLDTGAGAEKIFKKATNAKGETPESILQKAEDKIVFAVDANKNLVYVDKFRTKNQYLNPITGIDIGRRSSTQIKSTTIATPDYIIEASPYSYEKGTGRIRENRAVKKLPKLKSQSGLYEGKYDPRKAFFSSADFTWDDLGSLIKRIDDFGKIEFDGYRFKMEEYKKGDNIEYKIISPSVVNDERSKPEHYVILTMIFSNKCGLNMTYWEAATGSGQVLQKYTWEYEFVNGVYLPKKLIVKFYGPKGEVTNEYDYTYKNNKVNQEISPGTFECTNLNLKDGDVLVDEISKEEYRYEESTHTFKPFLKK
jgi:hypothetical protein